MEQTKVSAYLAMKCAFSTFIAHIQLYLPLVAGAFAVTLSLPYLKQYVESTELIPAGHLDLLSSFVIGISLQAWFWGVCVVVAVRILYDGRVYISDVIQSLKYVPHIVLIVALVRLPVVIIKLWSPSIEKLNPENLNVFYITAQLLSPVVWGVAALEIYIFTVFALIWLLYGQLAVPAFIIEKTTVWRAITLSIYRSHRLLWKIIEVLLSWLLLVLVIWAMLWGGIYVSEGTTIGDMVKQFIEGTPATPFEYPLLALAYVHLYKQLQQKMQAAADIIK